CCRDRPPARGRYNARRRCNRAAVARGARRDRRRAATCPLPARRRLACSPSPHWWRRHTARTRSGPPRPSPYSSTCRRNSSSCVYSHVRVIGTAATLGHHPVDILGRILDVAGLAVHTVLRVDLQPRLAVTDAHDLVHARRTIALFRRIIEPIIY